MKQHEHSITEGQGKFSGRESSSCSTKGTHTELCYSGLLLGHEVEQIQNKAHA